MTGIRNMAFHDLQPSVWYAAVGCLLLEDFWSYVNAVSSLCWSQQRRSWFWSSVGWTVGGCCMLDLQIRRALFLFHSKCISRLSSLVGRENFIQGLMEGMSSHLHFHRDSDLSLLPESSRWGNQGSKRRNNPTYTVLEYGSVKNFSNLKLVLSSEWFTE